MKIKEAFEIHTDIKLELRKNSALHKLPMHNTMLYSISSLVIKAKVDSCFDNCLEMINDKIDNGVWKIKYI